MKILKTDISSTTLSCLLQKIFSYLPIQYTPLFTDWRNNRRNNYYRNTPLCHWICTLPRTQNFLTVNKPDMVKRIHNIRIQTKHSEEIIISIHFNRRGIFGIILPEDIDELDTNTINTDDCIEEKIQQSPYFDGFKDTEEFTDDFYPIDMYLPLVSQKFTINQVSYCEFISLKDDDMIVINDITKALFLLNTLTGTARLLFEQPVDFINAFTRNQLQDLGLTLPVIKNIHQPDCEDIINWIDSRSNWPISFWGYSVLHRIENDACIFAKANDPYCKAKLFFVHVLYLLISKYREAIACKKQDSELEITATLTHDSSDIQEYSSLITRYKKRITYFMNQINHTAQPEIIEWKKQADKLLNNEIKFDQYFWTNYLYHEAYHAND